VHDRLQNRSLGGGLQIRGRSVRRMCLAHGGRLGASAASGWAPGGGWAADWMGTAERGWGAGRVGRQGRRRVGL